MPVEGEPTMSPLLEPDVQDMFGPPERYADSQPINFVRADAPPMLLIHGLKDTTVWPKNRAIWRPPRAPEAWR